MDLVPHFVEPGDAQDNVRELPIFVTRQADEAARAQRLAALAAALDDTKKRCRTGPVNVKQCAKPCSATDFG